MALSNNTYKILFLLQIVALIVHIFIVSSQISRYSPTTPVAASSVCQCIERYRKWKPYDMYDSPVPFCSALMDDTGNRGQLSNCSRADILRRPGVMLLTTTNVAFLDMMLNMLESIKRIGLCVNTTIIAEDLTVYTYLQKRAEGDPGVHVVMTDSSEINGTMDVEKYNTFLKKRQGYILNFLKQGLEVLFSDVDTFWFRDPFPYFQGDFDMSMIDPRSPYPLRTPKSYYCAGFAYFKPTAVALQFVTAWIQALKKTNTQDQVMMNRLLKADKPVHVNVQSLDTNIFPPGPKFYQLLEQKANYSTVVMHAASIHGHNAKVAKFKSSKMWLVNTRMEDFNLSAHLGKQQG